MDVWGTVPAYFGGIALILTISVLIRDRNEKVRSQADHLAAWVQRSTEDGVPHQIVVKNASNLPCVDVGVWFTEGYRSPSKLRLSKAFGMDTDGRRKPRYLHAVGPDETVVVLKTTEDVAVRQLTFTDAAGRHWSRVDGRLTQHGAAWWPAGRRLASRLRGRLRGLAAVVRQRRTDEAA